ncbi:MAG: SH3 domain-containing protein [Methylobacteriaceae bacterium]|nr:SH3 domain-containing protein [Methylobacteriaceae bacterium]
MTLARPLFALAVLLALPAPLQAGELCRVADPTGTPLNVRTAPNFKIVGALRNGTRVEILQVVRGDDGKQWAFIADAADGRAHGWVFRSYLDCR